MHVCGRETGWGRGGVEWVVFKMRCMYMRFLLFVKHFVQHLMFEKCYIKFGLIIIVIHGITTVLSHLY